MRTVIPVGLSIVFWLGAVVTGSAQQSPENSGSDSPGTTQMRDSSCEPKHASDKIVVVKEGITTGLLIHKVNPHYPESARRAYIEGTVVMCASISKEGKIDNLRAVSGPPELIPSSIKAVKKWRYKPYLLNGEPVEVDTEIRVNYALSR